MMVVKDSDLPAALPVVARFLDLSIPPSPQDGSELIPYDDRSVRAFTFNNGIGLPVNGVNSKQHEAAETCQGQQIIKQRLQVRITLLLVGLNSKQPVESIHRVCTVSSTGCIGAV